MFVVVLLLILNAAISWWNCYAVGAVWAESKALGGFIRLVAWSAAIQSAVGFSSVIGFLVGGVLVETGVLPMQVARAAADLWYLLIIIPVLGSGLIITIHSWIAAFRERSITNMGVAAYNTFAQASNMYQAVSAVPNAWRGVAGLFDSDDEAAGKLVILAVLLAVGSLLAGVALTAFLIRHYSRRLPLPAREVAA